jgi:PII-like signaling protein
MAWRYGRKAIMKTMDIIFVRIYITESSHTLNTLINYLKNETAIRGVSVFRAIQGFGSTGEHTASLLDLALDLPLVIEFFDSKDKLNPVLEHLSKMIKPEHIVFWEAKANNSL